MRAFNVSHEACGGKFDEVASGKGHAQMALINARNSAHDFNVKLNPWLCSDISCSGWEMTGICDTHLFLVRALATDALSSSPQ